MNIADSEINYTNKINNINMLTPITIANKIDRHGIINKLLQEGAKRTMDIFGGIAGIILLIPITIVLYIANIIVKDNGPLFYSQLRIGKNGKLFRIWKFRSMVVGADEKLEEYLRENPEAREEYKINKKLKNDPRITKIGEFIRKTSIDEIPQFINVLKGDMSIVGPRPYLPREKEDMGSYYSCITKCKPGITGFWQVNGRSEVNFAERLNMDMVYFRGRSFKRDIKILIMTVGKIVKKDGAI